MAKYTAIKENSVIKFNFKAETPSEVFGYDTLRELTVKVHGLLEQGNLSLEEQKFVEMATIAMVFLHLGEPTNEAVLIVLHTLIDESIVSLRELLEYANKLDPETRYNLAGRLSVLATPEASNPTV